MKTSSTLYKWIGSIFCFLLLFNGWGTSEANAAPMTQSTAKILRIKQDGLQEPNCGGTWSEACDLQYGLTTRVASDNSASWELWVSEGIYLPTTDAADRTASFHLKNNVSLYGAFRGDEQTRAERHGSYSGTILSGDIDGEAGTRHSCHVVSSDASVQTALLDSFMIRDGQAEGPECLDKAGGGLYNKGGNPWLQNVEFLLNQADLGGGMYTQASNPLLVMVSFDYNTAQLGGGMYSQDSVVMLNQVSFYSNFAESGGGMYNLRGSPGMERVRFLYNQAQTGGGITNISVDGGYIGFTTFLQNYAEDSGAGVYNAAGSSLELTNVTLTGNSAVGPGGAVANLGSNTVLDHVTVVENDAQSGSGIYSDASSSTQVIGSILWGNQPDQVAGAGFVVTYSAVQGGYVGEGNTDQDVLLGAPFSPDSFNMVLPLLPGSSAIDAITGPTSRLCPWEDQRGVGRPQGSACDMGAYEARPFTITPISGDRMAARVNDPFPQPLTVRVEGTDGDPVDGGIIRFRAPREGASAQFSHPDVVIYQDKASTGVTANSVPGAYEVTATARGATEAHFHLLNRDFTARVYRVTQHGAADDPTCGQTWSASCDLQYTLRSLAVADDQVWVAKGTYFPTSTATDRAATFAIPSGVQIYGGFAGDEDRLDLRDWQVNETALSGDIDHNDAVEPFQINGANTFTVVTMTNAGPNTLLDGFTIIAGQAVTSGSITAGGLVSINGSPRLSNLRLIGNQATNSPVGGMYISGGGPSLYKVTFEHNTGKVGGLKCDSSSPSLSEVSFLANEGTLNGGAMYNAAGSSPALDHVVFEGNIASGGGGAIYNDASSPTLRNVILSNNSAREGGAVFNRQVNQSVLTDVTIKNNTARGGGGGGIYSDGGGAPTLTRVVFEGNRADLQGGGMLNAGGSSPVLIDVRFQGNSAGAGGGMANIQSNKPSLTNVTFIENTAVNGGGIVNGSYSETTLAQVTFKNNSAQRGGGMYNRWGVKVTMDSALFEGNSAAQYGGAVYNENATLTLTGTIVRQNTAQKGGGIYSFQSNNTITDVTFSDNTALTSGGGFYNQSSGANLNRVTFVKNSAKQGGGMLVDSAYVGWIARLTNVTMAYNSAEKGGALYLWNGYGSRNLELAFVTLYENTADYGGGLYYDGLNDAPSPGIIGSIFWANAPDQIYRNRGQVPVVTYSLIQNGYSGTGNRSDDPLLGDLGPNGGLTETLPLRFGSPAANAVPAAQCVNAWEDPLDIDQRGMTRPQSTGCDMGAYELPASYSIYLPVLHNKDQ